MKRTGSGNPKTADGISTAKATKSTLRKDEDGTGTNIAGLIRINLGDGSEIYMGMEVKGVVKELSQEDLLLAVKNCNFRVVEALCANYKLTNVCEIRGIHGTFEVMKREVYNISNWNLLLIAIAYNHLQAIKFFAQKLKCHLRLALRTPPIASFSKVQESDPAHAETFALLLAINNRNEDMLKFLWTEMRLLWDSFHLAYVVSELASSRFVEGIRVLLRSQTAHEIYMSMHSAEKLRFLRQALATEKRHQRKWALEVKEALKEELTGQNPYATVSLFVLLNDGGAGADSTASFNLNRLHLERALEHVDAFEYARFRHTLGSSDPGSTNGKKSEDFGNIVTMKVAEYMAQEESNSMRQFGVKLKERLEHLDQEVVKLKAPGVANSLDFEQIFGVKLFALAEQGSLREFCDLVQENDVRLFTKLKRYETVARKLPNSFQGLNRYGYMSPLLVAIQKGHHALVSFIIEQMKVPLRQSLYLYPSDPGTTSSNIDAISEEYQAYALLVACQNKDEQMLRYLWQCLGSYLWTERHFEPLMRALIETHWDAGIRAILQSEMTHDMIRALSSEERAFFVDNMIGDNLKIAATIMGNSSMSSDNPAPVTLRSVTIRAQEAQVLAEEKAKLSDEIQTVLKEELCKQPYAGLFVMHLLNHFEDLNEDDLIYWDRCCQMTLDQSVMRGSEGSQGGPMTLGDRPKGILKNRKEALEETKRTSSSSGGVLDMEIQPTPPKYGLYKTELLLLSKSQQSRFCHFILDYGVNRKDDIYRQEALKFIECLRVLPEYEPLIEEGSEEAILNGDEEVKFIKKDLTSARTLTGPAEHLSDILKFSITGNIKQLQKLIELASLQQDAHSLHTMILSTRGLAVKAYDHSRDNTLIATREWNPIHFVIFFQQYKLLRLYVHEMLSGVAPGGLSADVKAAICFSRTENEFKGDPSYDDVVGLHSSETHLYGFMLAILTKNMAIFKYLYEETGIQLSESDVIRILRLCLNAHWPLGFLRVINSTVTARIFTFGSLDFKEEFVRFALIECESLVSKSVASHSKSGGPSQSDEDVIREVKDRMTEYPYCCLSWLYFDPFHKELKNQRYIKRLMEETSFNIKALQVLAVANQLDKILKKCDKPRINFDFLGEPSAMLSNDDDHQIQIKVGNTQEAGVEQANDPDELAIRNKQEDLMNQKIHEHKMMYVNKVKEIIENGGAATAYLKKGNLCSDICENIVIEILQKPILPGPNAAQDRLNKFEEFLNTTLPPSMQQEDGADTSSEQHKRIAMMLRFVSGYYNFSYWRTLQLKAPLDQVEMEAINLFQWLIFFNEHRIMNTLLTKTPAGQIIQLSQCLTGDQQPLECILTDSTSGDDIHTIQFEKVGLILAICRRAFDCLKILLIPRSDPQLSWSRNLLTNQEILELALIIMHEPQDLWSHFASFDKNIQGEAGKPTVTLESRLMNMVESAFVGSSFGKRLEFLKLAFKCAKHGFKEGSFLDFLLKQATHVRYFLQWLNTQAMAECVEPMMIEVKTLMRSMQIQDLKVKDAGYEDEMGKLDFIGRFKQRKVESALIDQVTAAAQRQQIEEEEMIDDNKGVGGAGAAHARGKSSGGGNRVMFEERDSAEADSD